MAKKSHAYIWQSVICFGFLSGLWTAIGIDPEGVVLTLIGKTIGTLYPDPDIQYLFVILPVILLLLSIYQAWKKGRVPGIAAVIVAYVAGLSVLLSWETALVLLCAAVILGWLATNRRLMRKLGFR
jgi:predicted branched-subunit amino acid permease